MRRNDMDSGVDTILSKIKLGVCLVMVGRGRDSSVDWGGWVAHGC